MSKGASVTSAEAWPRMRRHLPGGVNSNVRLSAPPVLFQRAEGAWMWDIDGNAYVDYLLGQGPSFLGHANPVVNQAVHDAVAGGMLYGNSHLLEAEAAERICSALGWAQMVRLGLTGTESVQAALRLARAVTGRQRLIRFEGHYHGWLDNVLVGPTGHGPASKGQLAAHLADSVVLPWNDAGAVEAALREHHDQIAAVLMEPIMVNAGTIEPRPGYLQRVRELCTEHGVVLIFDEVISGFRIALGGAAAHYGVTPDLATYGKAMAGGWPVAALAGRAELMERFGTGEVNHSGTFNGSVMAAAAVVATIDLLRSDPPYQRVTDHGTALMSGLIELADKHDLPLRVQGLPMAFHASFGPRTPVFDHRELRQLDLARYADFANLLADHGVWAAARGVWYSSAAHGERELAATLERVDAAMSEIKG